MHPSAAGIGVLRYGDVEQSDVRFSLLCVNRYEPFSIGGPDRHVLSGCPRRRAVPDHKAWHIEIKVRGQIAGFRVWNKIEDPQVRLRIRINRMCSSRTERYLFTVGTKGQRASGGAEPAIQVDRRDLYWLAAGCCHRVKINSWKLVIGFIDSVRP